MDGWKAAKGLVTVACGGANTGVGCGIAATSGRAATSTEPGAVGAAPGVTATVAGWRGAENGALVEGRFKGTLGCAGTPSPCTSRNCAGTGVPTDNTIARGR